MAMADAPIMIAGGGLVAAIAALGAELQTLSTESGAALLHDGASFWEGRAPILFPIVGALAGGRYRWQGHPYALAQHGFARRRLFTLVDHGADRATFRLEEDDESLAVYPFRFRLDVTHRLGARGLETIAELHNPATEPLFASIGFHPALRWPLPFGGARTDHRLLFDRDEVDALASISAQALIAASPRPTPVQGRGLALDDGLFTQDALVWPRIRSRGLDYGVPGRMGLRITFPEARTLGVWTRPGAPFLCIEPWAGHADPEGFDGDLAEKPGICRIEPRESLRFSMTIGLRPFPQDFRP